MFGQKGSSSKLAWARMPKLSQNICKSIKLKVAENQIDWVIQIDVVEKQFTEGGGGRGGAKSSLRPITNRVKEYSGVGAFL